MVRATGAGFHIVEGAADMLPSLIMFKVENKNEIKS